MTDATPATPATPATAYRPIPGPADRTTFFEAQRRYRRASRRFSLLAAAAVFLTGLPLSIVITPFLYAAALVGGYALNAFAPLSPDTWRQMRQVPLLIVNAVGAMSASGPTAARLPLREEILFALALVAPGAIFLLLAWIGLRIVFRHAGVGGILLTLGARDPNVNDLEERQLMNVVEEMAIAAGVPPPRVMLIDADPAGGAANAAAVGWSIEDATIVVTRPLLDGLRRDETQAIIGRLIGGVGNGDLKIALIILSVFQAVGLVTVGLNAFFGRRSWVVLWRLLRLALTPRRAKGHDVLASNVMSLLAGSADFSDDDDYTRYIDKHSDPKGCMAVLQLPLLLCVGFPLFTCRFIIGMSTSIVTGPLIGAMWKRRELLADATAVQLTRNPDGLASALEALAPMAVEIPRAVTVSHLFAVWHPGRRNAPTPAQAAALREIMQAASVDDKMKAIAAIRDAGLAALAAESSGQPPRAADTAAAQQKSEQESGAAATMSRYMHASLAKRLKQLTALGAHPEPQLRPGVTPAGALRSRPTHPPWIAVAILVPLAAIVIGLLGVAFVLIMMLDLVFMEIMLGLVWIASYLVFVKAPVLWHAWSTRSVHPR